jgi:predicted nuclease of predicted toxin-antitoxin system
MKLLADVNLDADIVGGLRADGHDVEWLAENPAARTLDDPAVMERAYRQGQIIITKDKGFPRYVFVEKRPTHGVILLRVGIVPMSMPRQVERGLSAIRAYLTRAPGRFTTIYPERIDSEALPERREPPQRERPHQRRR